MAAQIVASFRLAPSDAAYDFAESAAARVRDRDAPLRRRFVRTEDDQPPPLARLLRGGETRLKLYLSVLWIAVKSPHSTNFPAAAWAQLIGLADPTTAGARKVHDGIRWLERESLLRVERMPGQPSTLFLLDDAGRGTQYQAPYISSEAYIKLPLGFWTNQWISALSGRAVALLIILLEVRSIDDPEEPKWVSPNRARERYALSADTWSRGIRELEAQGLITVGRQAVNAGAFSWTRQRNLYTVKAARLQERPHWD